MILQLRDAYKALAAHYKQAFFQKSEKNIFLFVLRSPTWRRKRFGHLVAFWSAT